VADTSLMCIETSEEGGAGGAATGGVVELSEAEAVGGEGVEIGGLDLAAVATDVGVAHVIGHDDDDIGAGVKERGEEKEE